MLKSRNYACVLQHQIEATAFISRVHFTCMDGRSLGGWKLKTKLFRLINTVRHFAPGWFYTKICMFFYSVKCITPLIQQSKFKCQFHNIFWCQTTWRIWHMSMHLSITLFDTWGATFRTNMGNLSVTYNWHQRRPMKISLLNSISGAPIKNKPGGFYTIGGSVIFSEKGKVCFQSVL